MTASKESEESIEDIDNKNGLFTYFLLDELQKENQRDNIPIESIFTPISEAVVRRAKETFHHSQTPTMGGRIVGGIYLPKFKNKLSYKPPFIDIPKAELLRTQIPVATIQLSDKEQEKEINKQISFIVNNSGLEEKIQKLEFEKVCSKIFSKISEKYEEIFLNMSADINKVGVAVALLEATSFQFIMLGNVVASYGNNSQMQLYSYYVTQILKLGEGRSGYVVFTTIPEIVVADIISSIGINCIAREDLTPLEKLLYTPVPSDYEKSKPLYLFDNIYYCDAVGRNSTKVHDHIRELLASYSWITELAPKLETSKILDYSLQLNFLITTLLYLNNTDLWADFARFEGRRIKPLIDLIANDSGFRKQLGNLLHVPEEAIKDTIVKAFYKIRQDWNKYASGYFWGSIDNLEEIIYSDLELEKFKSKSTN